VIRLRRYLVAGLLVWLPVGATILVFRLLLGLIERLLFWMPAEYRPEALIGFNVPGLNAAVAGTLALAVLLATGILAANFLGKRLVTTYESLLARIPLVRSVYSAVKQIAEVVFSDSDSSFTRVLLIEYPRKELYCIAFQTSENARELQARTGEPIVTVFLPTTPNPTSGFILFVPRRDTIVLDMSVEEALKMIVSLGVVVPPWHAAHPGNAVPRPAEPSTATADAEMSFAAAEPLPSSTEAEPVPSSTEAELQPSSAAEPVPSSAAAEPKSSSTEAEPQSSPAAADDSHRPGALARPKAAP
jgi:uncharacterized membrane protein